MSALHDIVLLSFSMFVVGTVVGVALAMSLRDALRGAEREKHQETVIMQGQEIARLRAQVAMLALRYFDMTELIS